MQIEALILLLLLLALQPAVGFGLSNNTSPFFPYPSSTLSIFSLPALENLFLLPTELYTQYFKSWKTPCNYQNIYLVLFHPSSLNLSSLFLCSTFVTISFLLCGVLNPMPNPQPGGPVYPFLSVSSPLTCLAWEPLPVAYATASRVQDHVTTQVPPLRQSRDTFGRQSEAPNN
jgi:hypothetical protein